ncbi:CDP-glycerol glycerophosphotransferase family protein [Streptomyces sp. NBC_01142]|uniref:bifunctional glycosyltransferase/CDP-glycerol:glycerophosphate glycerophosphotransferase n=1 Tax=Streptomyces sp. NBC_01142 TaxID=2975865 RepID=UPI00224F1D81|nr:bifunctional glycosyltransferase/CDP-glycerol:glycerophosphate glycerophosphotransferase [Streptomyces sp. NBC_01142]MCX4823490.1 CDP-glycerol glycerophosphotransferase family protein [Streptomyces sp. NBC_01142]
MPLRLSVVVPVYNVEDYLEECLRSLADQTLRDLEVVMVDDGSTDGSAAIARRFAAEDDRFRLVPQANAGLGAARNTGIREARGEFLAFVDSDDLVPSDAYARMVSSLDASGSDLATGNVFRLRANGRTGQSPMFREPMATSRTATHVTRDWSLLYDRIACNKVFRRAFWDRHSFAFPEGVLFEDIPVILPAHFLAAAVDVLHETVYLWRDRDGSITTRRARPKAVQDRTRSVTSASRFLASEPKWAEGRRRYDTSVLSSDLWLFMEALPQGDAEYHEAFLDQAGAFAESVDRAVLDGLPLHLRVKWQLVRERRLTELLDLLSFEKKNRDAFRVRGVRRLRAAYPGVAARLPSRVTELNKADLPVMSDITEAAWRDGKLHIKGYAYVRNRPVGRLRRRALTLGWLRSGRRRVLPLRLRTVFMPEATADSRQGMHCYDRAGFETVVDPARLGDSATWSLEVGILRATSLRRGPLRMLGNPAAPAVHHVRDDLRIVPELSGNKLRLKAERVAALLSGHRPVDGCVRIDGTVLSGAAPTALRLENRHTKEVHEVPAAVTDSGFTADVPLDVFVPDGAPRTSPWGVRLVRADGSRVPIGVRTAVDPGRYPLDDAARELVVTAGASGNLVLSDQSARPIVDAFALTPAGELTVEGSFPQHVFCEPELVLQHSGSHEEAVFDPMLKDGRFRAVLTPAAVEGIGGELPLAEGRWYLFLRARGESDTECYKPVRLAPAEHAAVPAVQRVHGRDFVLNRRFHDQLVLESGSALAAGERGGPHERRMRRRYASLRGGPRRDTVLFSSFDGRQYSDSPRAVHEELLRRESGFACLWVVRDQQAALPAGARAVEYGGNEWHEALATSRAVVTNTQLPQWFERGRDQFVVQTWHGTPLKRIGRDLLGTSQANRPYIESLPQRAGQWNLLVSPNRFSTPILRRAFGYEGEVIESGYPRNALLHAEDRHKVAASVRERLDIPEGKKVVLYAPTWREDRPKGSGYALDLRLDLTAARAALGDSHVLLVRRHYLVTDRLPETGGFVRDVSRYPDVAELMLVSDALVTDYSSLMFDFAQTGRPMLFHTYDLEHYRDTLRGFYFDFENRAPGPLLPGSPELIEALRDPAAATAGHARAYDAFREVFCDLDDAGAAAAVADRVLRELTGR